MKFRAIRTLGGAGFALLASGLAGCALLPQKGWGTPPPDAPPLVYDCTVVTISSPTRYACSDGKVYTTFALEKKRLAWETAMNTETHPARIPTLH